MQWVKGKGKRVEVRPSREERKEALGGVDEWEHEEKKKENDLPKPFLETSHKGCVYLGRRFAQKIQWEEKEKCFPERVVKKHRRKSRKIPEAGHPTVLLPAIKEKHQFFALEIRSIQEAF